MTATWLSPMFTAAIITPLATMNLSSYERGLLGAKNRMLKFGYEVLRQEDKKLLATGETTHISCHRDGRVTHFPKKYKAAFLAIIAELPQRSSE